MKLSETQYKAILAREGYGTISDTGKTPQRGIQRAKRQMGSELERKFETLWRQLNGPPLEREYVFHPARQWRADFAHVASRVLIELEGGIWQTGDEQGRHTRGRGYREDCIKYNAAIIEGYTVFRLATGMCTADNVQMIIDYIEAQS